MGRVMLVSQEDALSSPTCYIAVTVSTYLRAIIKKQFNFLLSKGLYLPE
jgi:hypothetical protein